MGRGHEQARQPPMSIMSMVWSSQQRAVLRSIANGIKRMSRSWLLELHGSIMLHAHLCTNGLHTKGGSMSVPYASVSSSWQTWSYGKLRSILFMRHRVRRAQHLTESESYIAHSIPDSGRSRLQAHATRRDNRAVVSCCCFSSPKGKSWPVI